MLTLISVLLAIIICLRIFELDVFQPDGAVGELIPFIVSVISLLIAFLAFSISVKTYTSIDSVNSMTMMDGNIMENENYRTNIVLLLRALNEFDPDCFPKSKFRLFKKAEKESMKPVTLYMSKVHALIEGDFASGVRFADNIQKLMDYIIVLPYFINAKDIEVRKFAQKSARELKVKLESEVLAFANLSEGSTVLLQENARLLGEILKLQTKSDGEKKEAEKKETENKIDNVRITGVRGLMMKNPVSRTLYHDYVGLYYYNMALECMAKSLGCSRKEMFTINKINEAYTTGKLSAVAKHKSLMYLDMSLSSFENALNVIGDDLMWKSMIYYNIARASFYKMIASGVMSYDWEHYMDEAIRCRTDLNYIIADAVNSDTHLVRAFKDEETLARMTQILFRVAPAKSASSKDMDDWKHLVETSEAEIVADTYQMLSHPYDDIKPYIK